MLFGCLVIIAFGFFVAIVKKAVEGRDFRTELIIELVLLAICYILYQFLFD